MTGAIVVAGGRASRLGGVDKAALEVDGRALVDHVYAAVADCAPIVAVGPDSLARDDVVVTREDPPFAGPVAAVAAGLAHLGDVDETWLLACDLPRAAAIVDRLRDVPLTDDDGVLLVDAGDRAQWLAGRYRVAALRAAVDQLDRVENASMRRLLADLRIATVRDDDGASIDLDTPDDLSAYRNRSKENT